MKKIFKVFLVLITLALLLAAFSTTRYWAYLRIRANFVKSNLTGAFLLLTGRASQQQKLYFAINTGNVPEVAKLIKEGVDVNRKGNSPLIAACIGQQPEIVKMLLEAGADVNDIETISGSTALIYSVRNPKIVKILLEGNASVNTTNKSGMTALLYSAHDGNLEVVNLLLQAGADVNIADVQGMTPLALAVHFGPLSVVKRLVEAGADVNAKDKEGNTALKLAQKTGNEEIIQLLKSAGAKE